MSETNNKNGLFIGLNHGHVVRRPAASPYKTRPVTRKGRISKRSQAVREIIREVAGFSPLEKKMMEMIRTGDAHKEKKAVKHCRHKLGTHKRALNKRDLLTTIIIAQRRAQAKATEAAASAAN